MSLTSTSGTSARQVLEIGQPCDLWFHEAWRVMDLESIIRQQPYSYANRTKSRPAVAWTVASDSATVHGENPPFVVENPPFMTKTRHSWWHRSSVFGFMGDQRFWTGKRLRITDLKTSPAP